MTDGLEKNPGFCMFVEAVSFVPYALLANKPCPCVFNGSKGAEFYVWGRAGRVGNNMRHLSNDK